MLFFKKIRIALGEGFLDRFTVFECKRLMSLYVHVFNTVAQDRFHTHAFDGLAVVLKGGYEEEYVLEDGVVRRRRVGVGMRFIPKSYNHKILRSEPGTISVLLAGPWSATWTEENERYVRTMSWGRKELSRTYKDGVDDE